MTVEGSTSCDVPWSSSNTCLPTCTCTPVHTSRGLMTKSTFAHPPVCLAGVARQQAAWTPHLTCRTSEQPAAKAPSCTPLSTKHVLSIQNVKAKVNVFISGHFYRGFTMKISHSLQEIVDEISTCMPKRVFAAGIYYEDQLNQQDLSAKLNRKEKDKRICLCLCSTVALQHCRLRRIT